ncbi:MAG: flagellar motor switch phosphatase FliY [Clostridiales Family XIII bacterium]|jgi:flagellar motor switch protein FliN/FliY|nr:flagellar motor switch phosphatase FliY [Clostridiales Family XIII bacterium]
MANEDYLLDEMELDAIGEVMNISMGSAATAMSTIMDRKVSITTPDIRSIGVDEFDFEFLHPVIGVDIKYVEGIEGVNVLLLRRSDVAKMVGHLLSTDPDEMTELDEIGKSAICEIMNQMMGSAASALATFLGRSINISPPEILDSVEKDMVRDLFGIKGDSLVSIKFNLHIEGLVDSEFLSAMEPKLAKEIVSISMGVNGVAAEPDAAPPQAAAGLGAGSAEPQAAAEPQAPPPQAAAGPAPAPMGAPPADIPAAAPTAAEPGPTAQAPPNPPAGGQAYPGAYPYGPPADWPQPPPGAWGPPQGGYAAPPYPYAPYPGGQAMGHQDRVATSPYAFKTFGNVTGAGDQDNLELVMTVPIQISVELGRTRRKIKDIADLGVGNIVELDRQAGDQVDVIANGKLIARGDVVVVDDNYSVRITEIIKQPEEFA